MARVIGGVLEPDGREGGGTSFFVDPAAAARLSTELQAASDRLFDVELGVRSAVAAVDDPSAGAISGVLNELGVRTADLATTTGTIGDRMAEPLRQVAAMSGIPRIPEPGSIVTDAADLFLPPDRESVPITPRQARPPVPPLPAPNPLRDRTPAPPLPVPNPLRDRAPVPPLPEPSPFREFPLVPWPLFGVTDPTEAAARAQLQGARRLDDQLPLVTGTTTEFRFQLPTRDVRLPPLVPAPRGISHAIETARTLTVPDPLGGDPFAMYHVFGRAGGGVEGRAGSSPRGRVNDVTGLYQDVAFVRSQQSAAADRAGGPLPDRFDPALLAPGDQVSVTLLAPGDDINFGESSFEGTYILGLKYGTREWEGTRVALQRLAEPGLAEPNILDVGSASGERVRYELSAGLSGKWLERLGLSLTAKVGLQVNTRDETLEGVRLAFGDAQADPQGYAVARSSAERAVAGEDLWLPPGTEVDDYWRHRSEQTIDTEGALEAAIGRLPGVSVAMGGGGLARTTLTGSSVVTERTRDQTLLSNGPGGWTTYLDHGTGQDTVTIQHYGVDPDLDGSIPFDVPIVGTGMTVSLGELHLGGLREPFRTTIAKPYAVDVPDTPVQITVEALGRRSEFTQEQARERAQQLVAAADPRAANPVIRSLAEGEPWKDAIGYSGEPGGGSDYRDRVRALFGPSNSDVGEAAMAITDARADFSMFDVAAGDYSPFDSFGAVDLGATDYSALATFGTLDLGATDYSPFDGLGTVDLGATAYSPFDSFGTVDLGAPDFGGYEVPFDVGFDLSGAWAF